MLFATGLPPASVAAASAALAIMQDDRDTRAKAARKCPAIHSRAGARAAQSPIVPVIVGEAESGAGGVGHAGGASAIWSSPIRPPTVPPGHGPAAVCVFGDASGARHRACRRFLNEHGYMKRDDDHLPSHMESRSMSGLFITSVGTGIGKTLVTTILCHQLTCAGRTVRAIKPVVSGFSPDDPASDPALILRSLGREPTPQIDRGDRPLAIRGADCRRIWPREREGRTIDLEDIAAFCRRARARERRRLIVEGAGGVMAPIDDAHTGLDLIARLGYPVILVTGSYLGALSHTLTALAALRGRGIASGQSSCPNRTRAWDSAETVDSLGQFTVSILRVCSAETRGKRRGEMAQQHRRCIGSLRDR